MNKEIENFRLVLNRDAQHRLLTRNATKGQKGGRNRIHLPNFAPNRGRNKIFTQFLLKYRDRNYTHYQET